MQLKTANKLRDIYIAKLAYYVAQDKRHDASPHYDFLTAVKLSNKIEDTTRLIKRYNLLIKNRCTI